MGTVGLPVETKIENVFLDTLQSIKYSFEKDENKRFLGNPRVEIGTRLIQPPMIALTIDNFKGNRMDDSAYREIPMVIFIDFYHSYIDVNFQYQNFLKVAGKFRKLLEGTGINGIDGIGFNPKVSGNFVKTLIQVEGRQDMSIATMKMTYELSIDTTTYED